MSCRVRWSLPHCPLQIEIPLQLSLSFTNGTSGFSELLPGLPFPQVNQRKIISIPKGHILGLQTAQLQHRKWKFSVENVQSGNPYNKHPRAGWHVIWWEGLAAKASNEAPVSSHQSACRVLAAPCLVMVSGELAPTGPAMSPHTFYLTRWFQAPSRGGEQRGHSSLTI